jgi:hypothetical protein
MPHSDFQGINFGKRKCSIYSVKHCKSLHCDLNSFYLAEDTGALPINVTSILLVLLISAFPEIPAGIP